MVLTSIHNLCFEQKYENYQSFLSENFQFLEVKFSIYLNRHVLVMFESAMVNKPSVLESLKFYCISNYLSIYNVFLFYQIVMDSVVANSRTVD